MILHVLKLPNNRDVAHCVEVPDGTPAPQGWEPMTPAAFAQWSAPFEPIADDGQPPFDPATEKLVDNGILVEPTRRVRSWLVVPLTPEEVTAVSDAAERAAVKATREQIGTDIDASIEDQAQAQAYIDLAAPTNAERNQEVQNSAKRDKAAEQRYRRLARAVRSLLKAT